jgi:site-specific DNA-cytosine methylase
VRVLELFAGIGGCAAALAGRAEVVAAIDIHSQALDVYALNFPHPTCRLTIESIPDAAFGKWPADLWWLSPPCQPYTRRGLQRDTLDSRAAPLLSLIERIPRLRPQSLALENVPPFAQSVACARLRTTLKQCGYNVWECQLCPTQLGIPNRRERYYLVASQSTLKPPPLRPCAMRPLPAFLDDEPDPSLDLSPEVAQQYAEAIDVVDATESPAICACFTAAYGRSPIRSGSYLRTSNGLRRFSPQEVVRLLGFPDSFRLDPRLTREQAWRLVGNSLSVVAVAHVLSAIPDYLASTI